MISNKVAFESTMWCLHLPSKTTSFKIYARSYQHSIFSLTSHNKIVQFLINLSEWSDLFVNQSLWSRDVEMCQYITAIVVKNFILCYSLQIYNCETQPPASIGWVALSSVFVRSFVRSFVPHPLHLLSSPLYDVSDHTNQIFSVRIWSWQHVSVIHCWVEPSLLLSSFCLSLVFWGCHHFIFKPFGLWTETFWCVILCSMVYKYQMTSEQDTEAV